MKNKYAMPLIAVAALLVLGLVTTASYAYFIASVLGNESSSQNAITTGYMALEISDGPEVKLLNAIPGSSIEKNFTITNTGTVKTTYDVYLSELLNTFEDKEDLVYVLESENGCTNEMEEIVPSEGGEQSKIVSSCAINPNESHSYRLTITFKETNNNQDNNKGKKFKAIISINEYKEYNYTAELKNGVDVNQSIYKLFKKYSEYDVHANDTETTHHVGPEVLLHTINITNQEPDSNKEIIHLESDSSDYEILAWIDMDDEETVIHEEETYEENGEMHTYPELKERLGTLNLYTTSSNILLEKDSSYLFSRFFIYDYLDLSHFDTSNVVYMSRMFSLSHFENLDLSSFNTSNVEDMSDMFSCSSINSLSFGNNFDTSKVLSMGGMFDGLYGVKNLNLSTFNTSNVTNMESMFSGNVFLEVLNLGNNFDTSKVENMAWMFSNCEKLSELDVSNFNTSNVYDMYYMFSNMENIESLDISSFDTSNVTNMAGMFINMSKLKQLNLGNNFKTTNTEHIQYIFEGVSSLETLDLGTMDFTNVYNNIDSLFKNMTRLKTIYVDAEFIYPDDGLYWGGLFDGDVNLVGGKGTVYNSNHNDGWYGYIDCGEDRPGYLTLKASDEEYDNYCHQFSSSTSDPITNPDPLPSQ